MRVPKRSFVFFNAKYEILQLHPNGRLFCSSKIWNFVVPPDDHLLFLTEKCKILKTGTKRPFVFHSEISNLELNPNCHLFCDYKIRSCSKTVICFLTTNQKI